MKRSKKTRKHREDGTMNSISASSMVHIGGMFRRNAARKGLETGGEGGKKPNWDSSSVSRAEIFSEISASAKRQKEK